MRNSPNANEIAMPERTYRWRKVSADGIDVYILWNAPIAIPRRKIVFGRAESGGEAIAPSVEGERAGDGDGDGNGGDGDDGDADGTTSGDGVDSTRVNAVQLATDSQHMCQSRRSRRNDLPVSSRPLIQRERRPYGHVRRRRRRGRLKIERINCNQVSQTTYLGRAHVTQPPGNNSNQAYGVYRPRRRRGRIKIKPTNVSRMQMIGTTYHGRDIAMRSKWRPKRKIRRLNKLTFQCKMQGERRRDVGDYG